MRPECRPITVAQSPITLTASGFSIRMARRREPDAICCVGSSIVTGGATKSKWPTWAPSPYVDRPPARVEGTAWRISYVGHASLLIQTAGLNMLLDPVWSRRASPFRFVGPKRVNDPGIAFADLPPIDVVLVSHGHYDHLDLTTLSRIAAVHPARVITPLGNDTIMRNNNPAIAAEAYDWDSRVDIGMGVAVTLVAARHWSARNLADRNMSARCGLGKCGNCNPTILHARSCALFCRDVRQHWLSVQPWRPAFGQSLIVVAFVLLIGLVLNRRTGQHGQCLPVFAKSDNLLGRTGGSRAAEPIYNVNFGV